MPARLSLHRRGGSDAAQQLPFAGDSADELDFPAGEQSTAGSNTLPRARPIRAPSSASNALLSSSFSQRAPARSFAHQTSHSIVGTVTIPSDGHPVPTANGSTDSPQYSSHGVRERSSQLASYALDSDIYKSRDRRISFVDSDTASSRRGLYSDADTGDGRRSSDSYGTEAIEEDIEPESPETIRGSRRGAASSMSHSRSHGIGDLPELSVEDAEQDANTEVSPLLPKARLTRTDSQSKPKTVETSRTELRRPSTFNARIGATFNAGKEHVAELRRALMSPKTYTKDAAIAGATASLQTLSAVFLGLLLNILDALSYGYILFPLGTSIFSKTGPDGISIFFVSCIVSQLCYSLGLSVFRGGVGSEMIEVVPFFHKMTYSIMAKMKGESDEAVIATVIVAYCLSSIVTGLIFLALGGFKLGNLVSFFPRHILIGCIGGVGFFLVVTGIEVSARLEGNLNYDLATLHKLFSHDTVYLWILPLALAIVVLILRRLYKSPFILPAFFIIVFAAFYTIVKGILKLDLEHVRNSGWIFEKPEAGVPFYRFYSYFSESMFAMSLFNY
jgi:sulfate permease, SulP family